MDTPLPQPPDESLVKAALSGSDEAFALLVTRHKRRVFGLAARFSDNRDELEDLCQEVFVRAYEKLSSYRGDAPFGHWLIRIAVHACHDVLRRKRKERRSDCSDYFLENIRDHAGEARLEARQARELLKWAMDRIKPEERLVITLLELEEYTVQEISGFTGWSESNVKVRAHRARQALKRILEETS